MFIFHHIEVILAFLWKQFQFEHDFQFFYTFKNYQIMIFFYLIELLICTLVIFI